VRSTVKPISFNHKVPRESSCLKLKLNGCKEEINLTQKYQQLSVPQESHVILQSHWLRRSIFSKLLH
jgi:hypothetical protein